VIERLENRVMLAQDLTAGLQVLGTARAGDDRGATHHLDPPGQHIGPHAALLRRREARAGTVAEVAFALPGTAGDTVSATFTLTRRQAWYHNEVGLFLLDDAAGRVGGLSPGDPGYAAAALARRVRLFARRQPAGTVSHMTLPGGSYFGFYLIPNATAEHFLDGKPGVRPDHQPVAYFSFPGANADGFAHFRLPIPGRVRVEDLWRGGDQDFNDAIVTMHFETAGGIHASETAIGRSITSGSSESATHRFHMETQRHCARIPNRRVSAWSVATTIDDFPRH
jgi:hypothetical protein